MHRAKSCTEQAMPNKEDWVEKNSGRCAGSTWSNVIVGSPLSDLPFPIFSSARSATTLPYSRVENIRTFQFLDSQNTTFNPFQSAFSLLRNTEMPRVLWEYSFDLDWSIKWAVRLRHVGSSPGALSCGRVHVCLGGGRGLFQLPQICCATRAEQKHVAAACRGANFMSESAPDDMKVTGDTRVAELYLLFGIEARSFKCHNAT